MPETKKRSISFKVAEDDYEKLKQEASSLHLKVGQFVRQLVIEDLFKELIGRPAVPAIARELYHRLGEIQSRLEESDRIGSDEVEDLLTLLKEIRLELLGFNGTARHRRAFPSLELFQLDSGGKAS